MNREPTTIYTYDESISYLILKGLLNQEIPFSNLARLQCINNAKREPSIKDSYKVGELLPHLDCQENRHRSTRGQMSKA